MTTLPFLGIETVPLLCPCCAWPRAALGVLGASCSITGAPQWHGWGHLALGDASLWLFSVTQGTFLCVVSACCRLLSPCPRHLCVSVSLTAGYENYGYGYGYGQDSASYGYGMATSSSWEMPGSDTSANPSASGSASADSVLSRVNQRVDMVPHLESDMMQGSIYGSGGER